MPTEQPYLNQLNARSDKKQGERGQVKRKRQARGQDGEEIKQTEACDETALRYKHTQQRKSLETNLLSQHSAQIYKYNGHTYIKVHIVTIH